MKSHYEKENLEFQIKRFSYGYKFKLIGNISTTKCKQIEGML